MIAKGLLEKLELGEEFDKYNSLVGGVCEKYADMYMRDEIDYYEAQKLLEELETEEISRKICASPALESMEEHSRKIVDLYNSI